MILYIFSIIGFFLLDNLIAMLLPYDASFINISLVPQLSFMMLIIATRKLSFQNSIVLAMLLGFLLDVYGNSTFLIYLFLMIAMVFIAYFWSRNLTDTWFENGFFLVTTLFVKEVVLFVFMHLHMNSTILVMKWLINREFGTLLFNGICSFFVIWVATQIDGKLNELDDERRRGESVKWLQLRLKEENVISK